MYNIIKGGIIELKFIDRTGEIGYNNQGEKITIIAYRNCDDIDVQFEDGTIVYNRKYGKFKIGRIKHPIRYEESFAYHIEVELGLNLDDIWNWDKNNKNGINPYEIYRSSNKKVWLYCLEKDYHNDYGGYEITCGHFYEGKRCSYCRKQQKLHPKDSLAYNYPEIAKMIAIEENNLTFEDCYNISCYSNKKFYFKCNECNSISTKKKGLSNATLEKYVCEFCSDRLPITEKFMANVLKQLDEDFIYQLNKTNKEWCGYFKYDFYLPKYNIIIETNGMQHYIDKGKNSSWDNLEQVKMNDLFKYKCAKNHVDNYIVVDYRYSTLEWLKENTIKELSSYFDLSNIDWELVWEQSQNSLCIEALKLRKEEWSYKEISEKLKVSEGTLMRWFKNMGLKTQYDISDENKNRALELYNIGLSARAISKRLNLSESTVYKYIKQFK